MEIIKTDFEGLYIIQPKVFSDSRGYFFESFNQKEFEAAGISFLPVQDNESRSMSGVIRGLHYQLKPFDQAKLIRVILGSIYDVAVDLRRNKPTFGRWFGIGLDSDSKSQLFIPRGFAHGFSVLSDFAIIQYKCDNIYNPQYERGILFSDPALNIDWKIKGAQVVSDKDLKHPLLGGIENNF
jgi:dTDP-4-dehydrorhamnose 3,5-epimerase